MAKLADATDLRRNLSARRETGDAELLKVGETSQMAIPSQARRTNVRREGVETRRAAPKADASSGGHGEGIVQTTNSQSRNAAKEAAKAVAGKKIRWAARPVPVQVPPPAPTPTFIDF